MEGAPKIPQDNTEKPKASIADKLKRWAKIGAIASVGLLGADKITESSKVQRLEEDLKIGREHKIDSIVNVHEKEGAFLDYEEMLNQAYKNIENTEKEILDIKNKSGFYKDVDENYASRKLRKLEEDIEYLKKEVVPQISAMSPDSVRGDIVDAYKKYDEQHEWLNKIIHSDEYKERLEREVAPEEKEKFGKDLNEFLLDVRKYRLNNKDYNVLQGEDISENTTAHFKVKEDVVELPSKPRKENVSVGVHEFTHDLTYGGGAMTEKAKNLYTNSLDIDSLKEYLGNQFDIDKLYYYIDPTERDARKKVLEYDLEKLGVKKYEEIFTKEHYNKALELMEKGKLSEDSVEFIKMTKPEYFLQIMNEIAENKVAKEDNQNLA